MRVIAKMEDTQHPPLLKLFIHGAPHRRMHVKMIQAYRNELRRALHEADIFTPIKDPVDLWVLFVDPTSPDYDNLLTALYQAMDGATLRKPGILIDDGQIGTIQFLGKMMTPR